MLAAWLYSKSPYIVKLISSRKITDNIQLNHVHALSINSTSILLYSIKTLQYLLILSVYFRNLSKFLGDIKSFCCNNTCSLYLFWHNIAVAFCFISLQFLHNLLFHEYDPQLIHCMVELFKN